LSVVMAMCVVLTFPQLLLSQRPTPACPVATAVDPPPSRDTTYRARFADPRVNYSTTDDGQFLCRWHLERTASTAALADVVHPILYLVDAPEAWLPTILEGITAWEPVFERIGFRHV